MDDMDKRTRKYIYDTDTLIVEVKIFRQKGPSSEVGRMERPGVLTLLPIARSRVSRDRSACSGRTLFCNILEARTITDTSQKT